LSSALITLTSDFGYDDGYVGMMKGVIYSINPAALLVDLSHSIAAHNIGQGAFLLHQAYRHFPPTTINLAVVDPGVGTARRAICLIVPEVGYFVGPDNGLFSYIIKAEQERGANLTAFALTDPTYHRAEVSSTFHGRDIFAPIAAHLSLGEAPANFGPAVEIDQLVKLEKFWPEIVQKGQSRLIKGQVAQIDHFGNVITNIPANLLGELTQAQRDKIRFKCGWLTAKGLKQTYGQAKKGQLLILVSSSGFIEVARVEGMAYVYGTGVEGSPKITVGSPLTLSIS